MDSVRLTRQGRPRARAWPGVVLGLAGWSLACLAAAAEPDGVAPEGAAFFEQHIRPLLIEHCYECHSLGKKRKGGLLLDSRAGWAQGGDSGPAIVPGDAGRSLLITAVRYADQELEMPPDGRLTASQVALLKQWVAMGAPDPRTAPIPAGPATLQGPGVEQGREHWAFKRVARPDPPVVADAAWPRTPIDRFVLARLEAAGLRPAAEADRRVFIRRATFDLLGLPPTPDEVDAFVADPSADAHDALIERLLASPHYGERWGRRWLDLARYADTNGQDENLTHGFAWRYRDYVVRAFNQDKPYDRFLHEQIAGDLLPMPAARQDFVDQLTATGFLALGPKVLAEQDKPKLVMDVVDEQLDVLGKAAMGLTIGCARCHDHKFDPLPTRDYYALAGILKSSATLANLDHVSRWNERDLLTPDEQRAIETWNAEAKRLREGLSALRAEGARATVRRWGERLADALLAATALGARAWTVEAEAAPRGNLNPDDRVYGSPTTTIVHSTAAGVQFLEFDLDLPPGRYALDVRYASAEERPMRLLLNGAEVTAAACKAATGGFAATDQRWQAVAGIELRPGANLLRLERDVGVPHLDRLRLVPLAADADGLPGAHVDAWARTLLVAGDGHDPLLATWQAFAALPAEAFAAQSDAVAARIRAEAAADPARHSPLVPGLLGEQPPQSLRELAERYQALVIAAEAAVPEARRTIGEQRPKDAPTQAVAEEAVWRRLHDQDGPLFLAADDADRWLAGAEAETLKAQHEAIARHDAAKPPTPERVMTVREGPVADLAVHIRGSHLNLAETPTPRGVLAVTAHLVNRPAMPAASSGRLELARWLTDAEHPLTARVMVNRIWQGHFGEGLVRSPSNFGLRGEAPSHPELLDWLARTFQDAGWSMKAMHRLIMRSRVYRMDSAFRADCAERDPENRLLWRMSRRRLDAEAVRDGVLAVSGRLDRTMGGSLLKTANGDYVTTDQSVNNATYDALRRALYLPVVRNAMYDMFTSFDYADAGVPIDQRPVSTVAQQSLWLLNSPFVLEQALHFAERLMSRHGDDQPAALAEAYRLAYGRLPSAGELPRLEAFLAQAEALAPGAMHPASAGAVPPRRRAWQALCQALLASNEFLHVD